MKIPKPHHSSALDSLEFKRTRQLMWQDIQKKARPGRAMSWSWDFSLVFKRLGGALAVGVILGIGFANFGSVLSPEAYADYTLTYEPGSANEAPRFVLESKDTVDVEALSAQISFFPAVNYTIQRVDEDTVEIVLDRELEEEVQYKIALDDKPAAKNYEWTYEMKEDLEETTAPVELVPEVRVISVPEIQKIEVEPEHVEEKEPEEERSSGWNLPFFESLTVHEEEPVAVEIPEEVVIESEQFNGFPQTFPVLESTHVQTSSGVVEVGEPVVVTPIVETLPVTTVPTPVTINPVVTPVVVTPSSVSGPVTISTTPTPVTTTPVPTTATTTQTAPVTISTIPTPVTIAPVTPATQPVALLPDLTIERPSLTASTGILKMWIANRSGVAIGANVDSQISVTLDGAATPQWVFMWSTIVNKILIETGVYEIQTKVKVPMGHTVKICVDAKNEIKESNEENNCWEVKL